MAIPTKWKSSIESPHHPSNRFEEGGEHEAHGVRDARRQLKLLSDAIEKSYNGFAIFDAEGRYVYANRAHLTMWGFDTLGQLYECSPRDHFVDRRVLGKLIASLKVRGEAVTECSARRRDGSEFEVAVFARRDHDEAGREISVCTSLDITKRKEAESGLVEALREIETLKNQVEAENMDLRQQLSAAGTHKGIIGESAAIKTILAEVDQVSATDATVLLLGETGTGKELLARAIHDSSNRKDEPFVVVNCAAIPETLVESEFFGREKGAYTGAQVRQKGRFEAANGGTIFLDEIGELPLGVQGKILRVLQEGCFERLGSVQSTSVDIRVIAATNRDLEQEIEEGGFRPDLYYRVNVFPISLPPLRDRREDIPALVWKFAKEFSERMKKPIKAISRRSLRELDRYSWPGNIRELRNLVERAMILCPTTTLAIELPRDERKAVGTPLRTLAGLEKSHILSVLEDTNWKIRGRLGAAEILGLPPTTLESRMKKHGIKRPR